MSETPTLTGQDIGRAAYAVFALRDALLARVGTSFEHSLVLNLLATGAAGDRASVVRQLRSGVKIDDPAAEAAIDGGERRGLRPG